MLIYIPSSSSDNFEPKIRNSEYRKPEEPRPQNAPRLPYPNRAASPCSSSSSYATGDARHCRTEEQLHEGRVLPLAPSNHQNSNVPGLLEEPAVNVILWVYFKASFIIIDVL